jgi:lysophospholipase L1-like esterase
MGKKTNLLFLGASITQGRISVSFVNILKRTLDPRQYKFINQGIAGFESYNILTKLDKAVNTKPDFVILLGGTNDILSALDPKLSRLSRKLKKIPHEPSVSNFCQNITEIVKRLKQETYAKIAIASLPVLGENLDSKENKMVKEYNSELKFISETENVFYLPVFEKQVSFLNQVMQAKGRDCIKPSKMAFKSLAQHYLLFKGLDSISKKNGYILLTDGIHLNSIGSKFVADEIELFIRNSKINTNN